MIAKDIYEVTKAAKMYADRLALDADSAEAEGYKQAANDLRSWSARIVQHIGAVETGTIGIFERGE